MVTLSSALAPPGSQASAISKRAACSRIVYPPDGKRWTKYSGSMNETKPNPPDPADDIISAILTDVVVEVHVGLHPWERHPERPSRVVVNVEMTAATGPGRLDRDGAPLLDYDPVRAALRGWPARPHTELLETLVEE